MQTLEHLLANTLSFDIFQREAQGIKIEKAELEVMIESNKKGNYIGVSTEKCVNSFFFIHF